MWKLDSKKGLAPKNWGLQTMVLEKTLESLLDCKEITPVNPKGNQPWIFIGRTDAEAEALIFWPPDEKSWLTEKDPDARNYWKQEKKGTTEGERVGRHHRLNGHEFEQAPGDGEGQGSLACCSPWGHKESDTTEWLNNNKGTRIPEPYQGLFQSLLPRSVVTSHTIDTFAYFCLYINGIINITLLIFNIFLWESFMLLHIVIICLSPLLY